MPAITEIKVVLPAAGWPDQHHQFTCFNFQIDTVKCSHFLPAGIINLDHVLARVLLDYGLAFKNNRKVPKRITLIMLMMAAKTQIRLTPAR